MKIQDLSPPVAVPEPAWKQQLVEFWQRADDHHKIDLEVTLKMGDAAGARQIIESWQQEVIERQKKKSRPAKKKKSRVRYGYGGYWSPGFNFGGTELGGEGGGDGGGESINESVDTTQVLKTCFNDIVKDLGIKSPPQMILHSGSEWRTKTGSFGQYHPDDNVLHLAVGDRHVMDIIRTMAHELTHCRQNEIKALPSHAGETGSPWEDEANAMAGRILRDMSNRYPDLFETNNIHNVQNLGEAQQRQQQNESSGYIPTAKEKNDPRFSMALSPDVQPGATGKNANKMALKTGPQGEPQLLIKGLKNALREFKETGALNVATPTPAEIARKHGVDVAKIKQQLAQGIRVEQEHTTDVKLAREIALDHLNELPDYYTRLSQAEKINESEDLFEINMSPSNLERLVRDIDARAGIEFEMIVPGVDVDQDEEQEPDYDYDERVDSIADAERFFDDGDYNSSRSVRGMVESMTEDYETWKMEQLDEKWSEDGKDYLRDYIDRNNLFDRDEYMDQAREYVREKFADLAGIDEESEAFQDAVTERLDDIADEFAADAWDNQDNGYSDAQEEFNDEYADGFEESAWLRDQDYRYMTDIQNNYDMEWPYWQTVGGDGEMDIDSVADDFSQAIGRPVNASSSYHGGRREAGHYVVEPDSSLDPDNSGDGGLEFVSPPLPLDELLSDMDKVRAWAKQRGCYTNDSTGLHMNVSVPNTSTSKLDYVKLALLLGDERVLAEFGRSANTYAKSALGKIRTILQQKPQAADEVLNKMRGHMEALATKVIHTGNTDKYTSINTKDNYVEFRSPGGDWLDANWDKVKPTLLRTVVALDAAMDPEKYRKEYQKKLYKLLDSAQKQTPESTRVNKLLSMYFTADNEGSGREAARKLAKELLAKREWSKDVGKPGKQFWWAVWKNGKGADGAGVEVVAATDGEALDKAAKEFGLASAEYMPRADVELLRPYVETSKSTGPGNWGIWIKSTEQFAREPGEYPAGQEVPVRRFPSRDAAEQWIEQTRAQRPTLRRDIEVREIEPSVQNTGSTTSGEWGVWVPSLDRYATIGNAGPRRFENKAAAQAWIEDYNQRQPGNDLELQASKITNTFRAFDVGSGNTVGTFQASGPEGSQAANIAFSQYMQSIGRTNTAGFSYRGYREEEPLPDIPQQPAAAAELPGPPSAAASGEFTGEWKIVDANGQELHRFGGVGNVQADANATAIRWLQQNPRHMQAGVEVVPVMSE